MTSRSVDEHVSRVRALLEPALARRTELVAVTAALGRVLADDVHSPLDLPLFRNSQMDGFAVAAASVTDAPVTLPVAVTVAAGDAGPARLEPGTAVRIMTGAPVPEGADAIVPVEDTESTTDAVTVRVARREGEYVRERGSDVRAGTLLLAAGATLTARHLSMFAAVGMVEVPVLRRPRIAVITTGAELVGAGLPLRPGQIYDSNSIALSASLAANGAEVVSVDRSTDDPEQFREILYRAIASADAVITSGGVSMGEFEVVREVLTPLGGWFGHVAMQPGGPQGLAEVDGVPVLNFPGNPVSTLVSFEVFARSELRRAGGLAPVAEERAPLTVALTSAAGKRQFLRGRRVDGGVTLESGPGSHLVAALARADVLIDVPADVTAMEVGDDVRVWQL
ncbi:molybdopterin molybdotransferase MoeA [Rhodococcus spelaei]|uniref:Molybdopterin molybdenumtransferase n=1 Tax=Rhodococcus spelaei TaxID=2546320 RepID=A0A541BLS1_9NOCA|nr:gephyrin-like molybdotransferase Glp [Rhodococcus spelaei]TQF73267.1 molybdopterin molybdotransferase MoeA [Rhodococcus spelaei]